MVNLRLSFAFCKLGGCDAKARFSYLFGNYYTILIVVVGYIVPTGEASDYETLLTGKRVDLDWKADSGSRATELVAQIVKEMTGDDENPEVVQMGIDLFVDLMGPGNQDPATAFWWRPDSRQLIVQTGGYMLSGPENCEYGLYYPYNGPGRTPAQVWSVQIIGCESGQGEGSLDYVRPASVNYYRNTIEVVFLPPLGHEY